MQIIFIDFAQILYQLINKSRVRNKGMKPYKFAIPFIQSYQKNKKPFITMARVQTFLGSNFYSRLNSIYINICEATAKNNYKYFSSYFERQFSEKLISQMNQINSQKFRIKVKTPKAKITSIKSNKKLSHYLKFRQNEWDNNHTKIGLTCNVYFGQEFKHDNPFGKVTNKKIKIGQFRYLIYDSQISIFQNLLAWYRYQTYEFIIRYTSKMYLEVHSYGERNINDEDKELTSEVTMRSGNQEFDYVITDINGLSKSK